MTNELQVLVNGFFSEWFKFHKGVNHLFLLSLNRDLPERTFVLSKGVTYCEWIMTTEHPAEKKELEIVLNNWLSCIDENWKTIEHELVMDSKVQMRRLPMEYLLYKLSKILPDPSFTIHKTRGEIIVI